MDSHPLIPTQAPPSGLYRRRTRHTGILPAGRPTTSQYVEGNEPREDVPSATVCEMDQPKLYPERILTFVDQNRLHRRETGETRHQTANILWQVQ